MLFNASKYFRVRSSQRYFLLDMFTKETVQSDGCGRPSAEPKFPTDLAHPEALQEVSAPTDRRFGILEIKLPIASHCSVSGLSLSSYVSQQRPDISYVIYAAL
jgi:hypothetical protein